MENNEHMTNLLKVQGQAMADMEFRKKLIENPKETLNEMGIEVGDEMEIRVVENTSNTTYLTIPPVPEEGQLTDEQLEQVAGGAKCLGTAGTLGSAATAPATAGTVGTLGTAGSFSC